MGTDEALFLWVNRAMAGPTASALMGWATWLGDGLVLAILILPPMYLRARTTFRRHALPMAFAVALSGLAVTGTKVLVDRPRPPEHFAGLGVEVHAPAGVPRDRSFPSGHAQTAFGAAVYLSCVYPAWAPAFLLGAGLVAFSRVALGVHYPSDVLVGAALGSLSSLAAFLARRHGLRRRRGPRAEGATSGDDEGGRP